jgi:hypothetical protein
LRRRLLHWRFVRAASANLRLPAFQVLAKGGGKPCPSVLVCGRSAVHGINSTSRFNAGIAAESGRMA